MNLGAAMAVTALGGAIYLLLVHPSRLYAVLAALVAGLQVATAQGWVKFGIKGVSLGLVTAVVLTVCGVVMYTRTAAKLQVAAATLVAFVGAVQLLAALHVF